MSLICNSEVTPPDPCLSVDCPSYDSGVFDGRVCLGCFRDDYEIDHWDRLSFAEKAYALEDAFDRAQSVEIPEDKSKLREGAIPVEDLKFQASLWRTLAEKESAPEVAQTHIDSRPDLTDNQRLNKNIDADSTGEVTVHIPSIVAISANTPTIISTATNVPQAEIVKFKTANGGLTMETPNEELSVLKKDEVRFQQEERHQQSPPPPTPCTRICRYNVNCYECKVCIGCFRDTHDITQWSSMSHLEKSFSLEDAADRCKNLSERGKDTDTYFEGAITEAALRDQATHWGVWKGL